MWRDVSGAVRGGGSNGRWTVVSSDSTVENSPRPLKTTPYNDGASYWVDKENELLTMSFPAVLETDGKFSKIGPYFNLAREREIKVSFFPSHQKKKRNIFLQQPTMAALKSLMLV